MDIYANTNVYIVSILCPASRLSLPCVCVYWVLLVYYTYEWVLYCCVCGVTCVRAGCMRVLAAYVIYKFGKLPEKTNTTAKKFWENSPRTTRNKDQKRGTEKLRVYYYYCVCVCVYNQTKGESTESKSLSMRGLREMYVGAAQLRWVSPAHQYHSDFSVCQTKFTCGGLTEAQQTQMQVGCLMLRTQDRAIYCCGWKKIRACCCCCWPEILFIDDGSVYDKLL